MTPAVRIAAAIVGGVLLLAAGRALWMQAFADRAIARGDVQGALRHDPAQPRALLRQAEAEAKAGHDEDARKTAQRLLEAEPLDGRGWRVLAGIEERAGNPVRAERLYAIALRRAPRDIRTRAWWIDHELKRREFPAAIAQVDALLTMWPDRGTIVLPMVAKLADDPDFAAALAQRLQQRPTWRSNMLGALMDKASAAGANRVFGRMHAAGALDRDEENRWQDWMLRSGNWGAAYAYWASARLRQGRAPARLPLLDNGGFDEVVSGSGFDWHVGDVPGVLLDFGVDAGARGRAAHLRFSGREVAVIPLSHPLLLAPGRFRLSYRARSQGLRAELGLEWVLECVPGGATVAVDLPRIRDEIRGWHAFEGAFEVPATGCTGQWLRLRNPAAGVAAQLWGDLWLDDVAISR